MACPYNSYAEHLRKKYGHSVFRIGIDAGFSCPNRCKSPDGSGCSYCDSQGARAAYLRTAESMFNRSSGFESDIDSMSCSCDNTGVYSFNFDKENIRAQVERGVEFVRRRYRTDCFSAYLQSFSNTFAPVEKLRELYDFVLSLRPWQELIISTRPDCIDGKKLDLIASYKERGTGVCIELGLQSGDDEILKRMNRGHDVKCLVEAARAVKARGIELCLHVLTGYPGEGKAQLDRTIEVVNTVHPDSLKIHNLNIVAGTALYDDFLKGEVTAPCMTRHIENVIYILRRIPSDVVIERLMCETPPHRLACPRLFADKNRFLRAFEAEMHERNAVQGDFFKS